MERMAVFILFLIINLAGLGTVGSPPRQEVRPQAKVTATRAMVQKIKPQAGPIRLAGEEAVKADLTSQG